MPSGSHCVSFPTLHCAGCQFDQAFDRERFRRGALGEYVLYIDPEIPLHSGPIWTSDLGGVRLDDKDLSRIYYQLRLGAPIEIR